MKVSSENQVKEKGYSKNLCLKLALKSLCPLRTVNSERMGAIFYFILYCTNCHKMNFN